MVEWYTATLTRFVVVASSMVVLMYFTYRGMLLLGVHREAATGYALILPWFLGFLIWQLFPIVASLYLSFTEYNILQPPRWVGLDNYVQMFQRDRQFPPSVQLTFLYALISVPLGIIGAIFVAVLLSQHIKAVGIWRTIYYLPAVLPVFVTALLWRLMFLPTRSGLINSVTEPIWSQFADRPPRWFLDADMVLWAFVIMSFWGVFGANTVILLAGLKNIPRELYEAAEIDGAHGAQRFWYITIPQLSPTIFYVLVLGTIAALQTFEAPLFIELPPGSATFLQVYLYNQAFSFVRMGYGAALAWFLFVVILILTVLIFRSSQAWVYYESEVKEGRAA